MGPPAYGPQKCTDFFGALNVRYGPPDVSIEPPFGRSGPTFPLEIDYPSNTDMLQLACSRAAAISQTFCRILITSR